jgi:AcrR family transcriptional regulator
MTTTAPVARGPGRPRDPELDRAILEATIDVLETDGFHNLSIDAVAARAKVGKTTIYRRWPSKAPLVVDALAHLKAPSSREIPDDLSTRASLVRLMSDLVRRSSSAEQLLAGLVDEMARDPELAEAVRTRLVADRRRAIYEVLERGIERGEIRPDVDVEIVADLLGGPVVIRRLLTGRPVTTRFIREVVGMVLDGAATRERRP